MANNPRIKGNLKPFKPQDSTNSHLTFSNTFSCPPSTNETPIPSHLSLLFKKLNKRDFISLIKALDELLLQLPAFDISDLTLFLNSWPGVFTKLYSCPDKRVRISLFQAHLVLIELTKNQYANILKQTIGPWINALYDPFVQTLAQKAFDLAFSSKFINALTLCQEALLEYTHDILLFSTPESLVDLRFTSPEDAYSTFSRIISGCIHSLTLLFNKLSHETRSKQADRYNLILSNSKFWNFCHHESSTIRISICQLIKTICVQNICIDSQNILELNIESISSAFVSKIFSDKDPNSQTHAWELLLMLSNKNPQIWTLASKKKPILKKLFSFLKNGANSNGTLVYPCMIAVIAHLPQEIFIQGYESFSAEFLDSFYSGISINTNLNSFQVFFQSFFECGMYLVIQNSKNDSDSLKILDCGFITPFKDFIVENTNWTKSFQSEWTKCVGKMIKSSQIKASQIEYLISSMHKTIKEGISSLKFQDKALSTHELRLFLDNSLEMYRLLINSTEYSCLQTKSILNNYVIEIIELLLLKILPWQNSSSPIYNSFLMFGKTFNVTLTESPSTLQIFKKWINDQPVSLPNEDLDLYLDIYLFICNSIGGHDASNSWERVLDFVIKSKQISLLEKWLVKSQQSTFKFFTHDDLDAWIETAFNELQISTNRHVVSYSILLADRNVISKSVAENLLGNLITTLHNCTNLLMETTDPMNISKIENIFEIISIFEIKLNRNLASKIKQTEYDLLQLAFFKSCSGELSSQAFNLLSEIDSLSDSEIYFDKISYILTHESSHKGDHLEFSQMQNYLLKKSLDPKNTLDRLFNEYETKNISYWQPALSVIYPQFTSSVKIDILDPWIPRYVAVIQDLIKVRESSEFQYYSGAIYDCIRLKSFERNKNLFKSSFIESSDPIMNDSSLYNLIKKVGSEKWNFNTLEDIKDKAILTSNLWEIAISNAIFGNIADSYTLSIISKICFEMKNNQEMISNAKKLWKKGYYNASIGLLEGLDFYNDIIFLKQLIQAIESFSLKNIENAEDSYKIVSHFNLLNMYLQKDNDILKKSLSMPQITSIINCIQSWYVNPNMYKSIDENIHVGVARFLSSILGCVSSNLPISSCQFIKEFMIRFVIYENMGDTLLYVMFKLMQLVVEASKNDPSSWNMDKNMLAELLHQSIRIFTTKCAIHISINEPINRTQTVLSNWISSIFETKLISDQVFEELFPLLYSNNYNVQMTSLLLLQSKIKSQVQELSLKLEMNELQDDILLPDQIIANAKMHVPEWDSTLVDLNSCYQESKKQIMVGFMFSWMAIFDFMDDATFRLKTNFISHIRNQDIISPFLHALFEILGVGWTDVPFDLTKWDVEELYIESWDPYAADAIPLLAAHLLWRSLKIFPSLVRLWWNECKIRQLTLSVDNYIEKHMSVRIIKQQVSLLNNPESILENMHIKISKFGNEISASYSIEDSSLDLVIKFPINYPLRQIEIESGQSKMTGVPESKWRAWLLATTTLMVAQNGSVYDALNLFQRNVNLHFQDVEECAICYSIIGVIDNTLPSKQCKNCKHKFHSACLFKWFKTSNQSTCPLCRQSSF